MSLQDLKDEMARNLNGMTKDEASEAQVCVSCGKDASVFMDTLSEKSIVLAGYARNVKMKYLEKNSMPETTLPPIPRETVKIVNTMSQVFETLVNKANKSDNEMPSDLIAAHITMRLSITYFLDDTTDEEWIVPEEHHNFLVFLLQSRDVLKKLAIAQIADRIKGD